MFSSMIDLLPGAPASPPVPPGAPLVGRHPVLDLIHAALGVTRCRVFLGEGRAVDGELVVMVAELSTVPFAHPVTGDDCPQLDPRCF